MSAQPRVAIRRILVRVASAAQDGSDLDPALQALLAQRELLELFEAVAISCTVDCCVAENDVSYAGVEESWLDSSCAVAGFVWVG